MNARVVELQRRISALSVELIEELSKAEPPAPPLAPYLSILDFAHRLRVSKRSVERLIHDGLPVERVRKRIVRIPVAAADAWIATEAKRRAEGTH